MSINTLENFPERDTTIGTEPALGGDWFGKALFTSAEEFLTQGK